MANVAELEKQLEERQRELSESRSKRPAVKASVIEDLEEEVRELSVALAKARSDDREIFLDECAG